MSPDFHMPAEWEKHAATWLAWPHNAHDWPGKFESIPWFYVEVVRLLSRVERVEILVRSTTLRSKVTRMLRDGGADLRRVRLHVVPTDRSWTRDSIGPFVRRGERAGRARLALVDWKFNAWAKYPNWRRDDAAGRAVARRLGIRRFEPVAGPAGHERRVVMEGGAIDVNGAGLLLATEECLLSSTQARNPGLGRTAMERTLCDALGAEKVLWLGRGIAGDDTHGHVDDVARFVGPRTVVACVESNLGDPNHEPLAENLARLRRMRDLAGRRLEVVPLPMPAPLSFEGTRLPASYANFYIANGLVLVPIFHDAHDRLALTTLARVFPGRDVIGLSAVDLLLGLGTLHCMTQQQPA